MRSIAVAGAAVAGLVLGSAGAVAADDPRLGLAPGYLPWTQAQSGVELLDNDPRVAPFDAAPGNFGFVNSDLAFTGDHAVVGNFNGFQVYDLSDATDPVLESSFVCPGGQGDVSVYGDLLFMSVEETRGRIDCSTQGATGTVNPDRFRGVRIFDISDLANPVQLPGVQTCRGSHTHTLVSDPDDPSAVYVYNSGTSSVRSASELAGCSAGGPTTANPSQWRIDVIKVPLSAPQTAAIVSQPRIFADPTTGAVNGLQNGPTQPLHPSGTPYSPNPNTNTCHDITSFPAKQLVAGACQGNGIILDTSDPVNPVRLDAVADPNFSYWHSATWNNDGTKVVFTDEWGGGTSARCRVTDRPEWGANALFDLSADHELTFRSYYKMPVPQTTQENCVAHNMSLVPVPGRDIFVQAWYQGGMSVVDFSDTANPREIGYFDRGPINTPNPTGLNLGGLWSTYWYNGQVYGSEIARGFDTFGLTTGPWLSRNEIDAASEVRLEEFNAQHQLAITWAPSFAVVGSYLDQAVRSGELTGGTKQSTSTLVANARKHAEGGRPQAAAANLRAAANKLGTTGKPGELRAALLALAATYAP